MRQSDNDDSRTATTGLSFLHKGLLMMDHPLDKLWRILRLDFERSIEGGGFKFEAKDFLQLLGTRLFKGDLDKGVSSKALPAQNSETMSSAPVRVPVPVPAPVLASSLHRERDRETDRHRDRHTYNAADELPYIHFACPCPIHSTRPFLLSPPR